MRSAIPRYSERAAPRYALLYAAYEKVGNRTNRAINNLNLHDLVWENSHSNALAGFQEQHGNVLKVRAVIHCNVFVYIAMRAM